MYPILNLTHVLDFLDTSGMGVIDFNLGNLRSEIPSHYPTVNHSPCDYQTLNNRHNDEVTFKQNYTLLKSFGVSQLSFKLNTQSLTCITNDTRKAHNKGTKLAST
jgi:hypothetical protein